MTQPLASGTAPFDAQPKRNINDLSATEVSALMRKEFERDNTPFQHLFGDNTQIKQLDCGDYSKQFQTDLIQHLVDQRIMKGTEKLEDLHHTVSDELRAYTFNDGINGISKQCYDMPAPFQETYIRFIKEFLHEKVFKQPFYFQQTPTLRIHCPNAEHSDHYPRYHTDIGYGHPPSEINIWLPLTEITGEQQHGFRLSDLESTRHYLNEFDYQFGPFIDRAINDDSFTQELETKSPQVTTPFGSALLFDSRLLHSGEPLRQHTRASMDIRVIMCDDFHKDPILYQGTGRRKILFAPGHCYDLRSSDQL